MNNSRDYRHKWGKIDPSYLLSENGDLSFLLFFSKQCLVENIQGKFKKKFIGNFNFWGITLIRDVRWNTWFSHLSQLIVTWLKLSASTSFRAVALLSWQALLFETSLCNFFFPEFPRVTNLCNSIVAFVLKFICIIYWYLGSTWIWGFLGSFCLHKGLFSFSRWHRFSRFHVLFIFGIWLM